MDRPALTVTIPLILVGLVNSEHKDCYHDSGLSYTGKATQKGCVKWKVLLHFGIGTTGKEYRDQVNLIKHIENDTNHSYCRNPSIISNERINGVYCYLGNKTRRLCDVKKCKSPCSAAKNSSYSGTGEHELLKVLREICTEISRSKIECRPNEEEKEDAKKLRIKVLQTISKVVGMKQCIYTSGNGYESNWGTTKQTASSNSINTAAAHVKINRVAFIIGCSAVTVIFMVLVIILAIVCYKVRKLKIYYDDDLYSDRGSTSTYHLKVISHKSRGRRGKLGYSYANDNAMSLPSMSDYTPRQRRRGIKASFEYRRPPSSVFSDDSRYRSTGGQSLSSLNDVYRAEAYQYRERPSETDLGRSIFVGRNMNISTISSYPESSASDYVAPNEKRRYIENRIQTRNVDQSKHVANLRSLYNPTAANGMPANSKAEEAVETENNETEIKNKKPPTKSVFQNCMSELLKNASRRIDE